MLWSLLVACTCDPVDEVAVGVDDEIGSLVHATWEQSRDEEVWAEYRFDDEWEATPPAERWRGSQEQLIIGVPYDTDFELRLAWEGGATEPVEGHTDELPDQLLQPDLLVAEPDLWEDTGRYLLGSINSLDGGWTGGYYWKFIVDRQGRYIWAHPTEDKNWTLYLHVARDGGAILWDDLTYWNEWDEGAGSQVHRMRLDGTVEQTWDTTGAHHVFTELTDGTIAWQAASGSTETTELLHPDGEQETLWSCSEWQQSVGVNQHCQSNSLFWHEATDTLLISFYTSDSIVQVDGQTGESLRWWGELPGSWGFDPEDSQFWWQHGVTFTDEDTLLLSTYVSFNIPELVVREYELDKEVEVLREVWSFGDGEGVWGDTAGEAHRLPNGNTLHNFGAGSRVREITPDGEVVWDLNWEGSRLLGRTVFLDELYSLL